FSRSFRGNLRLMDRSIWVKPKPVISFRPSFPCRVVVGTENAPGFRNFPPGALECATQYGCPATTSRRDSAENPGSGEAKITTPLNGKPLRATTTESTDQSLVRSLSVPRLPNAGIA